MHGYGLPRAKDFEYPDCADIYTYGLKSSVGRSRSKSGDFKNSFRNAERKAARRRYWKSKARTANKRACREGLAEIW